MTQPTADEVEQLIEWAATVSPDDVGESPYEQMEPPPSEVDPADYAEQAVEVPMDDDREH